uniref:CSON006575 protein n=1 Tax=Culicoides sonorensis TaxID=179676 RepID=A0A336MXW6_CULSO
MSKHHRISGTDNKPPRISYLTHSPHRSMPPEILSIDESDTLLEEGMESVGEIISERRERRKNGSHLHETGMNRRLINPAVTIVEMTSPTDKVQQPLLTPLETNSPSPFAENNTNVNSTGIQLSMDKGLQEWGEATRSFVKAQQRRHAGRATFQGKIYNFLGNFPLK